MTVGSEGLHRDGREIVVIERQLGHGRRRSMIGEYAHPVNVSFLQELLSTIAEQGRQLLPRSLGGSEPKDDISELAAGAALRPRRGLGRRHRQRDPRPLPCAASRRSAAHFLALPGRQHAARRRRAWRAPPRPISATPMPAAVAALQAGGREPAPGVLPPPEPGARRHGRRSSPCAATCSRPPAIRRWPASTAT